MGTTLSGSCDRRSYFTLNTVFVLVLVYSVLDFQTSANTGIREAQRSGVHVVLLILIAFLGLHWFYRGWVHRVRISALSIPLLCITLWVGVVGCVQSANKWTLLVHVGLSSLWLLTYEFFRDYLRRRPGAWSRTLAGALAMAIFYSYSAVHTARSMATTYDTVVILNLAYNIIVIVPWILLIARRPFRLFMMALAASVVIMSMKRGAIIVLPAMLAASTVTEAVIKRKGGTALIRLVLMSVLLSAGLFTANHLTSGYLGKRLSPEALASGSGRALLYRQALQNIVERSPRDLLLGLGSGSSIELLGTGVHNEWLEFVFSFGVVGLLLYVLLIAAVLWNLRRLMKRSSIYAPAYSAAVAYMILIGVVGGTYFVHSMFYVVAFFGAVEALDSRPTAAG